LGKKPLRSISYSEEGSEKINCDERKKDEKTVADVCGRSGCGHDFIPGNLRCVVADVV
jgi:hypothetical protein